MGWDLFVEEKKCAGEYERGNLRCVSPSQRHLREKCWKNVIFYTCISGGAEYEETWWEGWGCGCSN